VRLAEPLLHSRCGPVTRCCRARSGYVYERIPKAEWRSSSSRKCGHLLPRHRCLAGQIEQIRTRRAALLHADLFKEHRLRRPRHLALRPPGCGKTLIAKRWRTRWQEGRGKVDDVGGAGKEGRASS